MKRVIIFMVFSLSINAVSAQDIKVIVRNSGVPVSYAHIYLNEEIVAAADSLGEARIPKISLKIGDVISATFLGMNETLAVYDELAAQTGVINISMGDTSVGEVIVKGKDLSQRIFTKEVYRRFHMDWYLKYTGDFRVKLEKTGEYKGTFMSATLPAEYISQTKKADFEIYPENKVDSIEDMSQLITAVRGAFRNALLAPSTPIPNMNVQHLYLSTYTDPEMEIDEANQPLIFKYPFITPMISRLAILEDRDFRLSPPPKGYLASIPPFETDENMILKYKGIEDNIHTFEIIRPYFERDSGYLQKHITTIYVDDYNMEISTAKIDWVDEKSGVIMSLIADYDYSRSSDLYHYRYPVSVTGKLYMEYADTFMFAEVELNNIKIRSWNPNFDKWKVPYVIPGNISNIMFMIL